MRRSLQPLVLPFGATIRNFAFRNCLAQPLTIMRFSRNQNIGALLLLAAIWIVILYRMLFSGV
jgi:hypothetical protein